MLIIQRTLSNKEEINYYTYDNRWHKDGKRRRINKCKIISTKI